MPENLPVDWPDIIEHASIQPGVANFPDRMQALIADIRRLTHDPAAAYHAAQPDVRDPAAPLVFGDGSHAGGVVNPYYEGEAGAIRQDPWTEVPMLFQYTRFRNDMDLLASQLANFLDRCDPARFHDVADRLREVENLLRRAQGSNGMDLVEASLQGWDGDAATNFRHSFYGQFNDIVVGQAELLRSVAVAALAYQQIIMSAQEDSLDIATQIREKLARTGEGLSLGPLLKIVAVVARAAAIGSGWGVVAWAASTSLLALDGIKKHSQEPPKQERVVDGDLAMTFIPSAHTVLDRLWKAINNEESMLREGIQSNNGKLEGNIKGGLEPREPDLANSDRRSDLGSKSHVTEYDIEELQRCAMGWLPAMAEMFHQAYLQLVPAIGHLNHMLGDNRVAGSQRYPLDEAIETLTTAVVKTRDYLYRCGENLSRIAGNYYQDEEKNAQIIRRIEAWLADPHEFDQDRYQPSSGRGGDSHEWRPV